MTDVFKYPTALKETNVEALSSNRKRKGGSQCQERGCHKKHDPAAKSQWKSVVNLPWKSSGTHHAPGFWDSLPTIYLTRRALQEFDRRKAQETSRDSAASRLTSREEPRETLQRYSRMGGPDLSDIRGVSFIRLDSHVSFSWKLTDNVASSAWSCHHASQFRPKARPGP